jgi:hypothetical protein
VNRRPRERHRYRLRALLWTGSNRCHSRGRGGHRRTRPCSLVPGIVDRVDVFEAERSDGRYLGDVGPRFRPVEMRGTTGEHNDGAVYRMSDHLFDDTHRVGPLSGSGKWDTPTDLAPATRKFLVQLADTAARRWQDKDQGIWEIRGEPRDFLYSKLMCWVALDRAVILADRLNASSRIGSWTQTRDQIREAIVTKGWSERAKAFTQSFGSDELDASNLMVPLVGFLPADDPRVLATVDAIEERLTDQRGLVYRYRSRDGLEGEEGTFLLCTFWLAQALAQAGQPVRARAVFERAAAFVNEVGLLAEEVDPMSGELLGNFPQAFSHIGLVNAAWAISESERHSQPT